MVGILSRKDQSVPTTPAATDGDWHSAMRNAIRDVAELCRRLHLPNELVQSSTGASRDFPLFVPLEYVQRMRPGDPNDPLLRQVLPAAQEGQQVAGFTADPVGDLTAMPAPGLLRKYAGRALLVVTGACAVHCRYCFRRHFPYQAARRGTQRWHSDLKRLAQDPAIEEVLLSGGDPLTLTDWSLADLVAGLEAIPHIQRLRVHTRLPVMIPQRVNDDLLRWLRTARLTPIFVIHANHPAELDGEAVTAALRRLVDAGIPVLNQSVLLRGINDSLDTLVELSRRLVNLRIMPYYLHQLDRVAGAAHFEVPVTEGRALLKGLRDCLPGYAVPRYVREMPGRSSKTPLE